MDCMWWKAYISSQEKKKKLKFTVKTKLYKKNLFQILDLKCCKILNKWWKREKMKGLTVPVNKACLGPWDQTKRNLVIT